jgi:hypothetical protein
MFLQNVCLLSIDCTALYHIDSTLYLQTFIIQCFLYRMPECLKACCDQHYCNYNPLLQLPVCRPHVCHSIPSTLAHHSLVTWS